MSGRRSTRKSSTSKSRSRQARNRRSRPRRVKASEGAGFRSVVERVAFVPADLILYDGRVYTHTVQGRKAQAIAVRDGRVMAVGRTEEILQLAGQETQKIDLRDRAVFPGFTDCHIHLVAYGLSLKQLNLREIQSISGLKELVGNVASSLEPGAWILGRGWDQDRFEEKRYPLRWDLDEAAPDNPVFLFRICGHVAVANSRALEEAGVDTNTMSVPSGIIDRVPNTGEPTGILRESCVSLVEEVIPKPTVEDYLDAARAACQAAVRTGLTSVNCVTYEPEEVRALQMLRLKGELPLRVYLMPALGEADGFLRFGFQSGFGEDRLRLGALKVFTDGSLGARTAALVDPYSDDPNNYGNLMYAQEELDRIVRTAHQNGIQLAIHAIGDLGVSAALDAIERAILVAPEVSHRHRIEHASVLSPDLIGRMRKLGVVASIQPRFIVSDFWAEERVGSDRFRYVYPLRSLVDAGIPVVAGSDCPVEPLDPLEGIIAAVKRDGTNMEEALTVEQALVAYTTAAARASFEEEWKGTLEPGKLADLIVTNKDPYELERDQLTRLQVDLTMVGGEIVFSRT